MKPCTHDNPYPSTLPVMIGQDQDGNPIVHKVLMVFCRDCGRRLDFGPGQRFERPALDLDVTMPTRNRQRLEFSDV